ELPAALDAVVAAGVNRVLTSGGAPSALDGAATLESLVRQAGGRVTVVAGGRVDAAAVQGLVRAGVRELHVGNDPRRLAAVIAAAGG
ncbi:MAG: copper homeostasis protein CutC, partial [Gemmatimonadaceae bacterium]|nr:copper homeostasis protein CutC [Gemmatimonadaceae bacterium]